VKSSSSVLQILRNGPKYSGDEGNLIGFGDQPAKGDVHA
jgi:hypothetical protein